MARKKKTLTLEQWTKLVKDKCLDGCGYPDRMWEYLQTEEAEEDIKSEYEARIMDYENGKLSWEQLTIGAVGSLAYCLHLMCD